MTTQATSAPSRQDTELETTPPHEQVEERAYYRYLDRGRADGRALEDWLTAEAEMRASPPRDGLIAKSRER